MPYQRKHLLAVFTGVIMQSLFCASSACAHRLINSSIEGAWFLEESELRHEISVGHFMLPPTQHLSFDDALPAPESLAPHLAQYMAKQNPVCIDHIRVPPIIRNPTLAHITQASYLNIITNYIKVSFTAAYAINMPPRRISMVWQLYTPPPATGWKGMVDADQDPYEIIQKFNVYGVGAFVYFSRKEPEFIWHAKAPGKRTSVIPSPSRKQLRIPIASLLLTLLMGLYLVQSKPRPLHIRVTIITLLLATAGLCLNHITVDMPDPFQRVSMPSDAEAIELFTELHANVYRAFDYSREEDIYDVLVQSVDGALLDDLYTQIYKSLILRYSGGAVCKVTEVEILKTTLIKKTDGGPSTSPTLAIDCRWKVTGMVDHWGHLHRRVNGYQAHFLLSAASGSWKISGIDITNQERINAEDTFDGNSE